ncbi:MAG: rhodanese-like domain-containing protein [Ectothiorhodospiraceae bacterium]|nr:MAG: rhodanese-like domain-containing protein [Ectothiorhodospiraceae bacterium]
MTAFIYNNIVLFSAFIILGLLIINHEIKSHFSPTKNINCDDLINAMNNSKALLIDMRNAEEFKAGHIVGAKNYSLDDLANLDVSVADDAIITYANDEKAAIQAADLIVKQGAKEVFYLEGGLSSWIDNNMPLSGGK